MMLPLLTVLAVTPIGFDEAIARALQSSPALRSADADRARALAQVEQARAPSLPSLSSGLTATRLDADRTLNDRVIAAANQLSANISLHVPLVATNRWAQWRRSAANAEAVGRASDDVRRQVALMVGRAWLSVLAQQRIEAAAQRSVDVEASFLAIARARRAADIGNELDELRADQELAQAKGQWANATGTLVRLRENLGVAMGADEPFAAEDTEPPWSSSAEADISPRTDVMAAQARVDAARVGTSWDWSDYLPLLTAVVQPGYQNPPTLTVPLWSMQAQLVLSIPLYDGGLRYGQQKERRALQQQAEALLDQARRQASAEVRSALGQVKAADEALAAARVSTTQARRVLSLAEQAFQAGGSTNLEVVDAERRARDAETGMALAEDAARQARLELLAAGGLFPALK
jgi:outer membrane protein TolC